MSNAPSQYLVRATEVVKETENKLRELVAQAATEGDYEAIGKITAGAKEVGAIAERILEGEVRRRPTRVGSRGTGSYPRFFRSNDNRLIMIGWSKKGQTEYEHRAPRVILEQLVSILLKEAPSGEPTPIDKILSQLTVEDGSLAPEYYGRTYLRWLRTVGLVDKHGHQGYSANEYNNFENEVSSYWRRLATR